MQEQTYLLLSFFSIFGVILSYCIPIVGGIIGAIAAGITLAPFSGGASLAIAAGNSTGML